MKSYKNNTPVLKLPLKHDTEIRAENITWLLNKQEKSKVRKYKQNLDTVLPRQFSGHIRNTITQQEIKKLKLKNSPSH